MRTVVHVLFLLSGVAGLVYQVAWVRQFALVFGSTVHSVSVVTATFLAGLGVGGWLAGRWADRHRSHLLRTWGLVEIGIGAMGLAIAVMWPQLTGWSAALSSYTTTPEAWHALSAASLVGRVAVAAAILAPPAIAMGATLTLLVRHQTAQVHDAGPRVGWLYGANTMGAALGALATDVVLVPLYGLFTTQLVAVGVNVSVGLVALALPSASPRPSLPDPRRRTPARHAGAVAGALFLTGFSAMAMELVWFRFFAGALGPYRAVFALLLAVLLTCSAAGAATAGLLVKHYGHPARWFAASQALFAATAIGGLLLYDPYALVERMHAAAPAFEAGGAFTRAWIVHQVNAVTLTGLVAVPAFAMGAAFPLGNAMAQDTDDGVGRRLGSLYAATTAGNVVGALAAGFLLLPGPGMQLTVLGLAAVALIAPLLVSRERVVMASLVPGAGALVALLAAPHDALVWAAMPSGRARPEGVLELREGLEQILMVTGRPEGPARLWTSGHPMTSTTPHAQRYMRAMAHVPLLLQEDPQRVLVICVGAGNTLHAASLHPVSSLEAVDLSRDILEVNRWFEHANHGVLHDERTSVFVNDGRHHLLVRDASYDLITLEPPPLAVAGVSSLYAREFYALAARRLTPTGMVAQWLPAYQVPAGAVESLVRAFVDVFPDAVLLVASGRELVLLGGSAPITMDPDEVRERLRQRPQVADDLARVGLGDVREIATTFAAAGPTLRAAVAEARPVTDDRPVLEHAQGSHLMSTKLPAALFAPRTWRAFCPRCEGVERVLDVTARLYATPGFLEYSSIVPDLTSVLEPPDLEPATLAAIASSASLTRVLVVPDALALRAQELWDAGEPEAARIHLDAARAQAPGVPLLDEMAARWGGPTAGP